jgi:hypothetical protein
MKKVVFCSLDSVGSLAIFLHAGSSSRGLVNVLNFTISPSVLPIEDIVGDVEKAISSLLVEAAEEV